MIEDKIANIIREEQKSDTDCRGLWIFEAAQRIANIIRPASGDAVEELERYTPGLRASRESLGITQDEQRRRAMAAASKMKAEGTASKPGPATTEAPAQTDENGKLTQPPPDRATPEERERRVRELVAKLTACQEADKAAAQTEQGGERADLQGQKQSADTTATPPTSAQTEAMALAVERLGFTIEERAGVDVVVYGGKEAGCRPANMNELALWSELQAALRQPASVEAEPVALLRKAQGLARSIVQNTGNVSDWHKKAKTLLNALADQVQS